ncbi:non-canonical purine NTP pyrophosphatase [Rhodococcus sp. IEGM 1408]|uniref:non-canonical purine NTP pyrophosphatase n=1 Tax=Rhodococcus sp. IEGM 1408 TaxID=3082220 RepID=UPI002954FB93|nr:non-canonical purine NTP pyrophosphatase [Rhodococcus sp. IEGM 1408]MDV8000803.1 non-canonical purine NTP pyrophosphatase [Rhodococcus sp. IEGM 1408]
MAVRLLVASRNAKKLAELRRVLEAEGIDGIEVIGLDEVPDFPEEPEDGATFKDNALIKARSGWKATGLACLADDSGLAVDALNGMPGVLSARWSGRHGDDEANNALLLAQLSDVPDDRRGAAFFSSCALVYSARDSAPSTATLMTRVAEGRWPGSVLREPRGEGGFGYDPLFLPEGSDRSAAELTPGEKDADSHRGRALRALVPALRELAERGRRR